MYPELFDKRILVTGGTGFIGGRLVERLVLECGARVRVLIRNLAHAPRIARFPIEMAPGDVTDAGAVKQAVEDCDLIFHCAYGNQGSDEIRRCHNVDGTRNILDAALLNRVKRVIHISTISVYGDSAASELDETHARSYTGAAYGDSKLDAEKLALGYANEHGLPVVVVQPTVVYGPFGTTWTVNVLQQLKTGRIILINGGAGLCNAVYVDDVVSALLLAAVKDQAPGEAFLVSAKQPVTWREFYSRYERMLGTAATVSMSVDEAEAYYMERQSRSKGILKEGLKLLRDPRTHERILRTNEGAALARAAKKIMPRAFWAALKRQVSDNDKAATRDESTNHGLIHPLPPPKIRFTSSTTRVSVNKAEQLLGYEPKFDFEAGMDVTEKWARWANLC